MYGSHLSAISHIDTGAGDTDGNSLQWNRRRSGMSRRETEVRFSSSGAEGLVSHGRDPFLLSLGLGAQNYPEGLTEPVTGWGT